jgi:hypothetical protein
MQVTPGTRPTQNRPPILVMPGQSDFTVPSAGGFLNFQIPQNAGVISMELVGLGDATPATDPNAVIQFFSAAQTFKTYLIDNSNYQGFIPIPPGATGVTVVNQDPAVNLLASIAWGIDG